MDASAFLPSSTASSSRSSESSRSSGSAVSVPGGARPCMGSAPCGARRETSSRSYSRASSTFFSPETMSCIRFNARLFACSSWQRAETSPTVRSTITAAVEAGERREELGGNAVVEHRLHRVVVRRRKGVLSLVETGVPDTRLAEAETPPVARASSGAAGIGRAASGQMVRLARLFSRRPPDELTRPSSSSGCPIEGETR